MSRKVYLTNADRALLRPKLIKFHKMNPSFSKTKLAEKFDVSYNTVKNWIDEESNNTNQESNIKGRPKKVQLKDCASTISYKNKISTVIMDGVLKEFVGIGWIKLRDATEKDYLIYPELDN